MNTDGTVEINCAGRTAYYMQYNSSGYFSCYKNTQADFCIYKLNSGTTTTKYTVTVDTAITGGTISASPTEAAEGTTITLTATPDDGYVLDEWLVVPDDDTVTVTVDANNQFTMPACNVEVTASFAEKESRTVSYYAAGTLVHTATVTDGDAIGTLYTPTAPDGWTFVGWVDATIDDPQDTKPTNLYTGEETVSGSDLTLYAVYGKASEGGSGTDGTFKLSVDYNGTTYYVGVKSGSYLLAQTDEADAVELGLEETTGGSYLYYLDGTTKYYIYGAGTSTSLSFSTTVPTTNGVWVVTEQDDGTITLYRGSRYLAFNYNNGSTPRFSTYTGSATYPYQLTKTGGTSLTNYTTNPGTMYTITWQANGETFATSTLAENSAVTAPEETPSMPDNGDNYFEFAGWSDSLTGTVLDSFPNATASVTYYAIFTTRTFCTVIWDVDGTTTTETYRAGETPVYPNGTPTKASDGTYSYTFSGWDPEITETTEGATVTYTAVFTQTPIEYKASLSLSASSVKAGRTVTATGTLTADGTAVTTYSPVYTSTATGVATVDSTGKITTIAAGTTDIVVTYTVGDATYTATATLIVVESTSTGGYTLITQDNAPTDWSGDYIIMGKIAGDTTNMNTWMILTPDYDSGTVKIAENYKDAATITITDDGSGVGTGVINDEGNRTSDVDKNIVMEDTGLVTDTDGGDVDVYDTITSIDSSYAFTIECIDDVNQIYTIRVKDSSLYIACSASTTTGNNSLNFSASATELAQWQFSVQRVTKGGYNNDIITAQNVGNSTRRLYFNSNQYAITTGQFRDYHSGAYGSMIGGNDSGQGQCYSLYLFGNPNPFSAQIYYQGDQITLVNTAEVPQGKAEIDLSSALLPNIDDYPNWTQVGEPTWSIMDQSSGSSMTIDPDTGAITTNGAVSGSYVLVTVTYVVRNEQTQATTNVSTTAKVEITGTDATYSTIVYETESGNDTEVQYTVTTKTDSLPLAAYVVNDLTDDNSKTGSVVFGDTNLVWSASSTNGYTVSVSTAGVLDLSGVTGDDIIVVTATGATGAGVTASAGTFKVYVKSVGYTAQITHDNGTTGNFNVAYGATDIALDQIVTNLNDETVSDGTFTLSTANAVWSVDAASGASIVKNADGTATLDVSGCAPGTQVTVRLSGMEATTIPGEGETAITSVVPATTIVVTVGAASAQGVDDTVVLDYDRTVVIDVLANDTYSGSVASMSVDTPAQGTAAVTDNKVSYTPVGELKAEISFTYTATMDNGSVVSASVHIVPAESVYYEDSNSNFDYVDGKRGEWTTDGTETVSEQTSSLSSSDIYEYDSNYASCATYSAGSAHMTTVAKSNNFTHDATNPSVSFTFFGTGFDVMSVSSNNSGVIRLQVKDQDGNVVTLNGDRLSKIVDTYYGYDYSETATTVVDYTQYTRYMKDAEGNFVAYTGTPSDTDDLTKDGYNYICLKDTHGSDSDTVSLEYTFIDQFYDADGNEDVNGFYVRSERQTNWTVCTGAAGSNALYQIPVITVSGLPYGQYTVTIEAAYSTAFDHQGDGSYDFVFDAVRIYDPCNTGLSYQYINIRDQIITEDYFGDGSGTPCAHLDITDWTLRTAATYTTSETTNGRGRFVKTCTNCGKVMESAYYYVTASATPATLDVEDSTNNTAALSYEITCDNEEVMAILNGLTFTQTWSSSDAKVMNCKSATATATAAGGGTAYARLQLKADGTVYASAIHTNDVAVTGCVHNYVSETIQEATCTENGEIKYTCTLCGKTFTETVEALGHDYGAAYSYDETNHWHECSRCSEKVDEGAHTLDYVVTQAPTTTTTGVGTYTCSVCQYSYTVEIPVITVVKYTVTFNVPSDATAQAAQTVEKGSFVTLPVMDDLNGWTFVGWMETDDEFVDGTETEPELYTETYTPTANVELTAVYSKGSSSSGDGSTFNLVTSAPTDGDWSGDYVIANLTDGTARILIADGTVTGNNYSTSSAVTTLTAAGISYNTNTLTGVTDNYVFTITKESDGYYSIKMKGASSDLYLIGNSTTSKSSLSTATAYGTTARWTMGGLGTNGNAYLVGNSGRYLGYNSDTSCFRAYASSNKDSYVAYLYKSSGSGSSTTLYTTKPVEEETPVEDVYTASITPASLVLAVEEGADLTAALNLNGTALASSEYTVTFASGSEDVALVDDTGYVIGAGAGTTTITATFETIVGDEWKTFTATCKVTVTDSSSSSVTYSTISSNAAATRSVETKATETEYNGAAFIDGKGEITSAADMATYGPKNEVYLSKGQAIVFYLVGDSAVSELQIGAKSVGETPANMVIVALNGTAGTAECLNTTINTSTEMYYEFGEKVRWDGVTSSAIVIQNTGDGILSLTNLRYQGGSLKFYINGTAAEDAEEVTKAIMRGDDIFTGDDSDPTDTGDQTVSVGQFTDLDSGKWYYPAVEYVVSEGLMVGVSDTTFGPNDNLTRGQLVTILYRMSGATAQASESTFSDVEANRYYTEAVIWAAENGVVTGFTDGTFRPNKDVTREEMVTIIYRYAEGAPVEEDHLSAFSDGASVSNFAKDAMNWAVANDIVHGVGNNTLDPKGTATRAQFANILLNSKNVLAS